MNPNRLFDDYLMGGEMAKTLGIRSVYEIYSIIYGNVKVIECLGTETDRICKLFFTGKDDRYHIGYTVREADGTIVDEDMIKEIPLYKLNKKTTYYMNRIYGMLEGYKPRKPRLNRSHK